MDEEKGEVEEVAFAGEDTRPGTRAGGLGFGA